jgi:hypothetical protein
MGFVKVVLKYICLLIVVITTASPGIADETVDCRAAFEGRVSEIVKAGLKEYREQYHWLKGAVPRLYIRNQSKLIHKLVLKQCESLESCSDEMIAMTLNDEVNRIMKDGSSYVGLTKLSGFWLGGLGLIYALNEFTHNPLVSMIVLVEFSAVTATLKEPLSLYYIPALRKMAFAYATGEKILKSNPGFVLQTKFDQRYAAAEAGKGAHQGFRNDVVNSIQALQNRYLLRTIMAALPDVLKKLDVAIRVSDEDLAREWASLFFFTRLYYKHIDTDNRQVLAIIRPIVHPFAEEIARLKHLIGIELDILEKNEVSIHSPGETFYPPEIDQFYHRLIFEWFERPAVVLRKPRSVFDPREDKKK